ncbi:MAG: helix-turn-helix domain-containing protein [Roseburia sp.]|nr:helix-turn-helix domain-containing protein [Roseburia sp.]
MDNFLYEEHNIVGKDFPFIFHTDRVYSENGTPNWHANIELLCCIQGNGIVKCGDAAHPFAAGDIVVINSDVFHTVYSSTEVLYHCLIVDIGFFHTNNMNVDKLYFQEKIEDEEMYSEFLRAADAFQTNRPYRNAVIKHAVLGFLILLCEKYASIRNEHMQDSPGGERMKKVINYIRKNISSDLSLDAIADSVGVSKYHLAREFKKYTDHTVFEEINMFRCMEAKRLIGEGMSVSAAAHSCGFENMSYFSRTYKKYMGGLPSEVAKMASLNEKL